MSEKGGPKDPRTSETLAHIRKRRMQQPGRIAPPVNGGKDRRHIAV